MKSLLNLALIFACAFSLVGCSYFTPKPNVGPGQVQQIDLTKADADHIYNNANLQPLDNLPALINSTTKGDVEYYPLNGDTLQAQDNKGETAAANTVSQLPGDSPAYTPVAYYADRSVEVFPLDGSMTNMIAPKMSAADTHVDEYSLAPPKLAAPERLPEVVGEDGSTVIVYFARDSSALNAQDLRKLARLAKASPSSPVAVVGFASTESSIQDPNKRKIANLKVSMDRALSVARALIERGVPAEQISASAHGETQATDSHEQSRRAEIHGLGAP